MIIKSMSRKHPSFAQLIDYIERESKLKSRDFSIYHNLYSRDRDRLKEEFSENARHLRFRKNGVYLYHEVLSITRSRHLEESEQKSALQIIVQEYLKARAKNNLAYAVLHEDTDNLHFHIVLSANEAGDSNRKRLSKAQFSDIQTSLEKWVLEAHPELEQHAVFHKNQTREERKEREAKKSHLSNRGEELKRRGGKTEKRDDLQERLADIFETATDPRHFADLMEQAGFTLYTRGQSHGVTDRDGNRHRLNRLGLSEAWQALDTRMTETMQRAKQATARPTEETTREYTTQRSGEAPKPQDEANEAHKTAHEAEADKRLAEMKATRAKQSTTTKHQDRDR
jgi:hypothetical protein